MKKKVLLFIALAFGIAIVAVAVARWNKGPDNVQRAQIAWKAGMPEVRSSKAGSRVPAYFQSAPTAGSLPPTLPAAEFFGKTRAAYKAVSQIPETIAQLPCYCHCDQSFGHKSLHSCFEDEHAASCAICVDEALLAQKLEKEQGLSVKQIREQIIAEFSKE